MNIFNKTSFIVLIVIVLFGLNENIHAQNATVYFDYQNNTFDSNQPLASEKYLQIHGRINKDVQLVKIELLKNRKMTKVKSSSIWKRPFGNTEEKFILNFNHKLQSDDRVNMYIKYYRATTIQDIEKLKMNLNLYIENYVNQTFTAKKKRLIFTKSDQKIIDELDEIVAIQLKNFENKSNMNFEGFSDIIKSKLSQIRKTNLNDSKFLYKKSEDENENNIKLKDELVKELNQLIYLELASALNTDLLVLEERNVIEQYPTEKNRKSVSLNAGYGVSFLGKTNNNTVDVGHAPYVGVSIPFSKSKINNSFARNLTFDIGVFLLNMKNSNGDVLSGPIIKRPIYFGFGYKFLKVVKVQAGYSVLEYQNNNNQFINIKNVIARPYVGLGVQFNLSMDFK